jgi:uncharacterized membrane protein
VARYATVSAKIPVDLKEKLRKYGIQVGPLISVLNQVHHINQLCIQVGPLIREAVEREVRRRELEEVDKDMEGASERLRKISDEEFARIIREARDAG